MTYSPAFIRAVELVLAQEGGYVDDPNDPGGETHFGISKAAYPSLDIKKLTEAEAIEIYHRDYWDAIGGDSLPAGLAVVAFDIAVNHGLGRLKGWLAEGHDTPVSLTARRMEFYTGLEEMWPEYGKGWARRAYRVLGVADKLDRGIYQT